jgi:tetratricopeptide (TPR) repeat protein
VAAPSCSAVLIVRDEEAVIEECLLSVRSLVDEVVVLDTGSRDRTRQLAANAGARVVESVWRDDFAAARNEALEHARGDWILSIDADERLVRGSRPDLMPLLAGEAVAHRVWLRIGPLFTPSRHCRLFRNDPRIRFEGRIRESVLPAIRRMGGVVADCDLRLDHRHDSAARSAKHARDLRLLEQALEDDSNNVLYWTDLGRARAGLGDTAGALDAFHQALDRVRRTSGRRVTDSLPYSDTLEYMAAGDTRRRALLEEALARFPQNQLLTWRHAEMLVAERRFAEAEPILRGLAGTNVEGDAASDLAYDRRIFDEFAYGALATCCYALGRWAEAAEWYGRAAALQPESVEYRAKHLVTLRRSGQPQ